MIAVAPQIVECPRDPGVETALRCSRCETPICPKCLVQSPVGARCKDCARVVKSPIYTLGAGHLLRGGLAASLGGLAIGAAWIGLMLALPLGGFFSIFVGAGLAWAFTKMMDFATGLKRGPIVVGFAIAGILIAWGMQFLVFDPRLAWSGVLAVGVGAYLAYQNLR